MANLLRRLMDAFKKADEPIDPHHHDANEGDEGIDDVIDN